MQFSDLLNFPLYSRMPYEWKTPLAYFITIQLQLIVSYYTYEVFVTTLIMFICFAYNVSAFVSDIEVHIREWNGELEAAEKEDRNDHLKIKSKLVEIMEFQAEAKV